MLVQISIRIEVYSSITWFSLRQHGFRIK